jgi:hypothetical protein
MDKIFITCGFNSSQTYVLVVEQLEELLERVRAKFVPGPADIHIRVCPFPLVDTLINVDFRRRKEGLNVTEKTFSIILEASPAVFLDEKLDFQAPHESYTFENITDEKSGTPIGLRITATIESTELKEAISRAEAFADGFTAYLSYLSRTSIPRPRVIKGFEVTPNKRKGQYIQYYYDWGVPTFSHRVVRDMHVSKVIDAFRNRDAKQLDSAKLSVHWYREGVRAPVLFDKFISFFISIESLNAFLVDYYGLSPEYNKCPSCGRPADFPTLNGVREHIKRANAGEKYWRRIHRLRNDITHGNKRLNDLLNEAIELVPILEKSLLIALDLFFSVEDQEHLDGESLTHDFPLIVQVLMEVSGPDLSLLKGQVPDISVEPSYVSTKRLEVNVYAKAKIPKGYSMESKGVSAKKAGYVADFDLKRLRLEMEWEDLSPSRK